MTTTTTTTTWAQGADAHGGDNNEEGAAHRLTWRRPFQPVRGTDARSDDDGDDTRHHHATTGATGTWSIDSHGNNCDDMGMGTGTATIAITIPTATTRRPGRRGRAPQTHAATTTANRARIMDRCGDGDNHHDMGSEHRRAQRRPGHNDNDGD